MAGDDHSPTSKDAPLPASLELATLGRAIDGILGGGHHEGIDLLTESRESRAFLSQMLACQTPLLPRDAAALLMAAAPYDGVTRAVTRCSSVLSTVASPLSAHITNALLELVAPSSRDAARTALLLSLLAPCLLGKDVIEARDDGGMAALLVSHLLLTRTLVTSTQLRGEASRRGGALPFTQCLQIPSAAVRGADLVLHEDLMDGVPIEKNELESSISLLSRVGLSLGGVILVVAATPPLPEPRGQAAAAAGCSCCSLPSSSASCASASPMKTSASGPEMAAAAAAASAGSSSAETLEGGARLRVGDCVVGVNGKLLTREGLKLIMHEVRHGRDGVRSSIATVSVLRVVSSAVVVGLAELPMYGSTPSTAAEEADAGGGGGGSCSSGDASERESLVARGSSPAGRQSAGSATGSPACRVVGSTASPAIASATTRSGPPSPTPPLDPDRRGLSPSKSVGAPLSVPASGALSPSRQPRAQPSLGLRPTGATAARACGGEGSAGTAAARAFSAACAAASSSPCAAAEAIASVGAAPVRLQHGRDGGEASGADAAVTDDGVVGPSAGAISSARARGMTSSVSIESLRSHFLKEAQERAMAEGERILQQKLSEAATKAQEVIEKAEVEAEAMRLRRRSQTQAEAEEQLRRKCEQASRREIARVTREHKAAIQQLHAQHAASVAALAAAVASLGPEHAGEVEQLQALSAAVNGMVEPPSPATSKATSSNPDHDAEPAPMVLPPPLPTLLSRPESDVLRSLRGAHAEEGVGERIEEGDHEDGSAPPSAARSEASSSLFSPRQPPTPLQMKAVSSLKEALASMGAGVATASVGVQTSASVRMINPPADARVGESDGIGDGDLEDGGHEHSLPGGCAASRGGDATISDLSPDGRLRRHSSEGGATSGGGADDEASGSASDRRGYDSASSSASDRAAGQLPPRPSVLSLQSGNVRITYNPGPTGVGDRGIRCARAGGVAAAAADGGGSVRVGGAMGGAAARHKQRREERKAMRLAQLDGGGAGAAAAAGAEGWAENVAAPRPGETDLRELAASGVHVLRAPGCVLRLHT